MKKMVILIGPSGVGKSSFLDQALKDFAILRDTITYTSRAMRPGEKEGVPYHFVSRERFLELTKQNYFIEFAEVHGNLYGTPFNQLDEAWAKGEIIIMDVDVQGAFTFQKLFKDALTVFVLPPSIDVLRQRIIRREGRPPKDLELRLKNAEKEISQAGSFRFQVVNDEFSLAYTQLKRLIESFLQSPGNH